MDDDAGPAEGYGDPVILPSGRESAVILLAPGSRLVFTGELFVSVLAGAATIHGHHLVPGVAPIRVASTLATALEAVYSAAAGGGGGGGRAGLRKGLAEKRAEVAADRQVPLDAVVVLRVTSVEPSPLRRLLGAIREYRTVFGREVEEEEDGPVILDGAVLFFESQERLKDAAFSSGYPFEEGQGWEGVLDDFVSVCDSKEPGELGGTMLLCGGQDSGKSTFGRWMMNKLLSRYPRIEFVDLDCGQTEFGPPGIISVTSVSSPVFGAPFTHGQNPVDARFIGSASPKGDPAAFFQSVVSLLEHHRERSLAGEQVPTVINTNGWVKGLGLQLILDTIRVAAPDMVVQLETSVAGRNLPGLSPLPPRELQLWACPDPSSADDPKVAVLPAVRWDNLPQKGKSFHFAPKNLRELALLSYFHSENVDGTAPWRVPLDAVRLAAPPDLIPPTEVLRVLNASIIGLLDSAGGASDYENGDLFVPVDPTRRCYGLGIVRAATTDLDTAEAEIYVSTPLPLARVCPRVIAVTQVQLPEAMLTPGGPYLSDFPTGGGIGGQVRKGRRNLGRKHAPSGP